MHLQKLHIPLFIEKPLYHRKNMEGVVSGIEKKQLLTYVACNLRFLACLNYLKEYLQAKSPRINEVNVYCGSYLPEWRKGTDYKKNYSAIPELGGGVHLDLIHEIDYVYWLFGYPKSVDSHFSNNSSLDIASLDYANYVLTYPCFNVGIVLNYYRKDTKRTLEIVCENETVEVDLLANTVSINGKNVFQSKEQIIGTYRKQMEYFLCCLGENKQTFNTIRDAFNVLKICIPS